MIRFARAARTRLERSLVLQTALVLALYVFVERFYFSFFYYGFTHFIPKLTALFTAAAPAPVLAADVPYFAPSMLLAALADPLFLAAAALANLPPLIFRRRMSWSSFALGKPFKYLVAFICAILGWAYAAYDYNYYLDQAHYLDRALLVLLAVLVFRTPAFLPAFLVAALLMMSQFDYPLGGYSLIDKKLLINMLLLFAVFLYLRPFFDLHPLLFVFLALCLHGSNYFVPGALKMSISPNLVEWPFANELWMHALNAQTRGWLGFLDRTTRAGIVDFVRAYNAPLLLVALAIELLGICLLFRARFTLFSLAAFDLLHIGIFVESGIFFWKWILLNIALIVLVGRLGRAHLDALFARRFRLLSLAVIALSPYYFKPVQLAWWDLRINSTFDIEAVGESGAAHLLNKNALAPYDMLFTFSRFRFLLDEPQLSPSGLTTADYRLYVKIRESGTAGLDSLRQQEGVSLYDAEQVGRLDRFIARSFQTLNERRGRGAWFGLLEAPHHIYTYYFAGTAPRRLAERAAAVRVRYRQYYYDGTRVVTLRDDIVREVAVPAAGATAAR